MTRTLFILNDAPYGNERVYNALRLVSTLVDKKDQYVQVFLLADAVVCAKTEQRVPDGYYDIQLC